MTGASSLLRWLLDRSATRSVPAHLAAALLLSAPGGRPAVANVMPESALLVHINPGPFDPDYCATCPITECDQIARYTDRNGVMEFDLFFYPWAYLGDHLGIRSLDVTLTWPESWSLLGFETCHDGIGSLTPAAQGHRLAVSWPDCPPLDDEVFFVGRVVLAVDVQGRLGDGGYGSASLDCSSPFEAQVWVVYAEAHALCDWCSVTCAGGEYCMPQLSTNRVELEVPEGEAALAAVPFTALHAAGLACPFVSLSDEAWLSTDIMVDDNQHYRLLLEADASTLAPGNYETWARVSVYHDTRRRCVRVALRVTSSASRPPEEPDRQVGSWGSVKDRYR